MGLLDRLFGRREERAEDDLLNRALDRTVEVVEPKLALTRDWRKRLAPGVEAAIEVARDAAQRLRDIHDLSAAAWAADRVIRAAFANADGIPQTLARSQELKRFFRSKDAGEEAFAVLGMAFEQKRVLGAALQGDAVIRDVARTQAIFGDHRIRIVAATADDLRRTSGARLFNELLLAATRRMAEVDKQKKDLEVTRALLQAKLRMLEHNETSFSADLDSGEPERDDPAAERAQIEQRLAAMTGAMGQLGGGVEGLERQLEIVRDTLLSAREVVTIEDRRLRLDAMNTVLPDDDPGGAQVDFHVLTSPAVTRAYIAVRVRREDMPAGGLAISDVERAL
jgi:hypothetical protein